MWPKEYIELKHIEDLLVCGICYEFMNTSVMTSCSHSYCSLCIRKYLHYKTQCPVCFVETFEKDLRKNKVIDEIIALFLQIKDKLKRTLEIQIQFGSSNKTDDNSNSPKVLHPSKDAPVAIQETKSVINKIISNTPILNNIVNYNVSPSRSTQNDISSPSTSGRHRIPLMFTPKSNKRAAILNTEDTKVVICPVCKVTVSELHINRHLDDCLKRESMKEKPQIVDSQRKPLPKLVFTLMKDVVLRKKLKEFGLSSQGDRKALEARLQRYIVLYNAECDKVNPRVVSELVKQCEDEENVEKKINKTTFLNKLQFNRNTEQNVIEDERKKYLEAHKESFASLINQIKSNVSPKKSSVRRSLLQENTESNEDVPFKRQAVVEDLDDSAVDSDLNDSKSLNSGVHIQDSDSDTVCPLQMYSSTDPKKLLNVGLSPSKNNNVQNKSEMNDEQNADQSMLSNYSSVNISKAEKNDSSDELSDTSIYDKATQAMIDNLFYKDALESDSKNSSNTSKYNKLRRGRLTLKDKVKRTDSNSNTDQEEEDDKSKCVLQDILCDFSSNDSIDSEQSHGKSRSTNRGVLNNSVVNFSNMEKENISSSPERSGNHSFRKRSRDPTQVDNKLPPSRRKKMKKSADHATETKESNILNDSEMESLQTKPRSRKRVPNISKGTTVLRKSTRTKPKMNN